MTRGKCRWLPSLDLSTLRLPKGEAACCLALTDNRGRLPIGYCGPSCERRERARLIREYVASSTLPAPRVVGSLDAHPGWQSWTDVWDDPTGEAALQGWCPSPPQHATGTIG